jgi:chromosome partitioning protein
MMADTIPGDDLRQYRASRGWEQPQLAAHLNEVLGRRYDQARISRWESGAERIPQIVAQAIRAEQPPVGGGIPTARNIAPALTLAVSLQKGGVAKTTTSVNVAYLLAKKGFRVLLVDGDPQGSATTNLGQDAHGLELKKKTLTTLLDSRSDLPTREALTPVCDNLFDLIASSIALSEIEVSLMSDPTSSLALREKLSEVSSDYDFIVIDTPPNLGLLTASALGAADLVLIPSQTEQLSLMGIPLLLRAIDRTKRRINRNLQVLGILPTHYDPRTVVDKAMLAELRTIAERHGVELFEPISRAVAYKESVLAGKPALERTPDVAGNESFRRIADRLVEIAETRAKEYAHEPV